MGDHVYQMKHDKRGHLLIISNKEFDDKVKFKTRTAAEKDCERLKDTFKKFGFETTLLQNLTATEMLKEVDKFTLLNHHLCDCVALAVMTHGGLLKDSGEDYLLGTDGIAVHLKHLIHLLKVTPSLFGKPKLIFVEAARGSMIDEGNLLNIESEYTELPIATANPNNIDVNVGLNPITILERPRVILAANVESTIRIRGLSIPTECDVITCYSTEKGYVSYRSERGSVFIQTVCDVLDENLDSNRDLASLTAVVNDRVSRYEDGYWSRKLNRTHKQIPVFCSSLRAPVYLIGKTRTLPPSPRPENDATRDIFSLGFVRRLWEWVSRARRAVEHEEAEERDMADQNLTKSTANE